MAWNITLKCQHRYQLPDAPDLARPLICGLTAKGQTGPDGLQMIVQATEALYDETLRHNALAAERRDREKKLTADRNRRDRRAAVARGDVDLAAELRASLVAARGEAGADAGH